MTQPTRFWHCSWCDRERMFIQPLCEDGHEECPEWLCVECGSAVVTGFPILVAAPAPEVRLGSAA